MIFNLFRACAGRNVVKANGVAKVTELAETPAQNEPNLIKVNFDAGKAAHSGRARRLSSVSATSTGTPSSAAQPHRSGQADSGTARSRRLSIPAMVLAVILRLPIIMAQGTLTSSLNATLSIVVVVGSLCLHCSIDTCHRSRVHANT